jgi:hypothetical protein
MLLGVLTTSHLVYFNDQVKEDERGRSSSMNGNEKGIHVSGKAGRKETKM